MTQFPIFVDADGCRVVAIVTVPEDAPRGLVISLAATGRHNVVGSTLCAYLSGPLAERGLASVRLDYTGTGDSRGLVPSWTPADVDAAVVQAQAVSTAVLDALGLTRFAAVGTCYGTRVALSLVPGDGCVGAVCLAPPVLDYGGFSRVSRRVGARRALAVLRSNALVRRAVAPLRGTVRARRPAARVVEAFDHLEGRRIAFLYGRDPWQDHYDGQVKEVLDGVLASLPSGRRDHFELRMLPWGPLTTFDILSPEDKESVLEVVVPLVSDAFDEATRGPAVAAAS
jgi:pimeloyl-ACP methyl ester carboxylesterase